MHLIDVGEFGLIDQIKSLLNANSPELIQSIGDDAAVFRWPENTSGIITTDCLVESVHFDFAYTSFEALGWKSLAVNLSDIAAMAAIPHYAVISLALTDKWSLDNVQKFYKGLKACSDKYHCPIIGGDTTRSKETSFISITVLGYAPENEIKLRSKAEPGDVIFVTGSLGKSRTGFEILSGHYPQKGFEKSIQHFLKPEPRLQEIQRINQAFEISSLIDISDGLSSDLLHICEQSQTGCELFAEQLPINEEVHYWCEGRDLDPIQFILESGEEYELLLTLPNQFKKDLEIFCHEQKISCYFLGNIVPADSGTMLIKNQKPELLEAIGWKHF